jgi:hypothetical protein
VSNPDHSPSPWGEPAPASGWQEEAVSARPEPSADRPSPVATRRRGDSRGEAAVAPQDELLDSDLEPISRADRPTGAGTRSAVAAPAQLKRGGQLVERTVLVRLLPKTSVFRRIRAIVALFVIATFIGLLVAGALGLAVWGIATAIHHAASN